MSERILITCGLVLRAGASDLDKLLLDIERQGITILRKQVSAADRIWLTVGDKPLNGNGGGQ